MFEIILNHLFEFLDSCKQKQLSILIGGGLGLYLKRKNIEEHQLKTRQLHLPAIRSTSDIDVFLPLEILTQADKMSALKEILKKLNYKPKVNYIHFIKSLESGISLKIDILSQIPKNLDGFKIKKPRIRRNDVEKLHAYMVPEAIDLDVHKQKIDLIINDKKISIFVPHPFNFIILKLFAFRDRINDEKTDYGRHHVFDVFTIISMLTKNEWQEVNNLYQKYKNDNTIKETCKIINQYFFSNDLLGIIRLKENTFFKYPEQVVEEFILDIKELFPGNQINI